MIANASPALSVRLPIKVDRKRPPSYTDPTSGARMTSIRRVVADTRPHYGVSTWAAEEALNWTLANTALAIRLSAVDFTTLARIEADNAQHRPAEVGAYVREVCLTIARALMEDTAAGLPPLPEHLAGTQLRIGKVKNKDGTETPIYADVEEFVERAVSEFLQFVADCRPVFKAVGLTVINRRIGAKGVAGTVDLIAYLPDRDVTACIKLTTAMRLDGKHVELAAQRRAKHAIGPDGAIVRAPDAGISMLWHMAPGFTAYRLTQVPGADDEKHWRQFLEDHRNFISHEQDTDNAGHLVILAGRSPRIEHLYDQGWGAALAPLKSAGCETVADVAQLVQAGAKIPKVGPVLGPVVQDLVAAYSPDGVAA